jgi:hypothetical protein
VSKSAELNPNRERCSDATGNTGNSKGMQESIREVHIAFREVEINFKRIETDFHASVVVSDKDPRIFLIQES